MTNDQKFLRLAVHEAKLSLEQGGFPAGSILTIDNKIVARGRSFGFIQHDPSGHSDAVCIRKACKKLKTTHLSSSTLYSSIEPCLMCFQTAFWAGVSRIVFACRKTQHMVDIGCYEGLNDLSEINQYNRKKIKLEFLDGYSDDVSALLEKWEQGVLVK